MSKFIKIIFFVILNFSLLLSFSTKASEKIKIGLMVPLTGENRDLGQSIIKAVRLAVKDINNNSIKSGIIFLLIIFLIHNEMH